MFQIPAEGYWIPESIDDTYEEEIIAGSAIIPPVGRSGPGAPSFPGEEILPGKDRYGVRTSMKLSEFELNLVHFRKYTDKATPVMSFDSGGGH